MQAPDRSRYRLLDLVLGYPKCLNKLQAKSGVGW